MAIQIQLRRDTAANWTSEDPTLAEGELGYETDTAQFKIGDGVTAWTALDYANINWTNATDNFETTGTVTATSFTGDGSNLTNVGAADASGVTIEGKAAENIAMGQAVYISGAAGNNVQFSLGDNTVAGKGDIVGLATSAKTTGQTLLVRTIGQLDNWDTSSWSDGDKLYLSTSGDLVNAAPTSGGIVHVGDVEYAHASLGDVLVHIGKTANRGAPAGTDIFNRMGDSAGANKVIFKDYANNEVAAIDSDGNITTSGTVDGIDIATDVTANTTDRHASGSDDQVSGDFTHDDLISGTIADHDTSATGAELDTLTDGSDSDGLHAHAVNDAKVSYSKTEVKGVINHGATAATARPTGFDSVEWIGSVEPDNANNDDTWIDTT